MSLRDCAAGSVGGCRHKFGEYRFGNQRGRCRCGGADDVRYWRLVPDEISAAVTTLFGAHALDYQAVSAQVSAFHQQFVQALNAAGGAYAGAEAANAAATANPVAGSSSSKYSM